MRVIPVLALGLGLLGGCGGGRELAPYREPPSRYSPGFGGVYHVVERGQTLWSIARTYGAKVGELRWVNGLKEGEPLRAGQRLFIPGARAPLDGGTAQPAP